MPSSDVVQESHFSLNQIDQTCRKAAKGVGFSWGAADDIGKAVRWLSAFQLTFLSEYVELLTAYQNTNPKDVIPKNVDSPLEATRGRLNPLATGMVLSDCLDEMIEKPMVATAMDYPIFVAGFLGQTALVQEQAVSLSWGKVALVLYRDELIINGDLSDLDVAYCDQLVCQRVDFPEKRKSAEGLRAPIMASAAVANSVWDELERLAHHTYVEATEQSRQAGAGAGLNDND